MEEHHRLYYREYRTGTVGLVHAFSGVAESDMRVWAADEVRGYAAEIGTHVQCDPENGWHAVGIEGRRMVGRYYFVASTPVDIPAAEGWQLIQEGSVKAIVFKHRFLGGTVEVIWPALKPDEADQHFGGYHKPWVTVPGNLFQPIEECEAIALMMHDEMRVEELVRRMDLVV